MENQKNANYGQESHTAQKQPWTPDYQKTNLNENANDNQGLESEDFDNESDLYPTNSRNIIDSNSAADTQNDEYIDDVDKEDYVHNKVDEDEEDNVHDDDEDEDEDKDDFQNEEDFEEDGDFQEKDIDYREKKERDSF
jgi:hypothetical protein